MARKSKKKEAVPTEQSVAPEVLDKPKRRRFTTTFKERAAIQAREKREAAKPAEQQARDQKRSVRASLHQLSTDGDLVDIWERRILNPNHQESASIRIKTPGMVLRWINLSNRGRFQRARYEQGWVPVHKTELMEEREIYGVSYTSEGHVCRGEKQTEMLMRMPSAVYRKIQDRRAELNRKSYQKLRENMASAGANHFKEKYGSDAGDQAAEAATKFQGSIKFGTEKVSTEEFFG